MLGRIIEIRDCNVVISLDIDISSQANLINLHVIFDDGKSKIVGEIKEVTKRTATIAIVGELFDNYFLPGVAKKPSFKCSVRMIKMNELAYILGEQKITDKSQTYFGISTIYPNYRINVDTNYFFSNHFAIIGNTGSGKSCTVARLLQNLFGGSSYSPINSNIFIFDAYGEYHNALSNINKINPVLNYKGYTTDLTEKDLSLLKIPVWLLTVDDLAQLLSVTSPNQLPILDKALRLARIFSTTNPNLNMYKNDILARAILDILVSGADSSKIRDQIVAILTNFNTNELNLKSEISEPGYIRTLKQCLFTDKTGKMQEMEKVVDFINKFVLDELVDMPNIDDNTFFTLTDLEHALDFALISEGSLKSEAIFDYANILSVRLHSLVSSDYANYFDCKDLIDKESFIRSLITAKNGKKAQIVNFNINSVDDRMAKALVKIISRILFSFSVEVKDRAKIPFHIIIEEAHRYVQNDNDINILGYNIFDRITKEGRKYGILLGLITQRPSELSETSLSQCSNFIILRTLYPRDLDFIKNMITDLTDGMSDSIKNLQPGSAIAFGSAFKVPVFLKFDKPNPEPLSNNADLMDLWY